MRGLIVTHGSLGQSFIESAEMIIGEGRQLDSICLKEDSGIADFSEKLLDFFTKIGDEKILILSDLENGSPYIQALACANKVLDPQNFSIITGCNLPIVLEFALSDELNLQKMKEHLLGVGKNAITGYESRTQIKDDDELL